MGKSEQNFPSGHTKFCAFNRQLILQNLAWWTQLELFFETRNKASANTESFGTKELFYYEKK